MPFAEGEPVGRGVVRPADGDQDPARPAGRRQVRAAVHQEGLSGHGPRQHQRGAHAHSRVDPAETQQRQARRGGHTEVGFEWASGGGWLVSVSCCVVCVCVYVCVCVCCVCVLCVCTCCVCVCVCVVCVCVCVCVRVCVCVCCVCVCVCVCVVCVVCVCVCVCVCVLCCGVVCVCVCVCVLCCGVVCVCVCCVVCVWGRGVVVCVPSRKDVMSHTHTHTERRPACLAEVFIAS